MVRQKDIDFIEEIISSFANGASREEIMGHLEAPIHTRTLQRHLAQIAKEGKIELIGKGRSTRYKTIIAENKQDIPISEFPIPLSNAGDQLRQYVEQKIQYRTPTGYNKNFLEKYQPNQTFYLPENIRKKFHKDGILDHSHKPGSTWSRQILSRLLIDLSFNSSRLEGNTYSLLETEHLLIDGEQPEGKNRFETQMILNHKNAINFLSTNIETINFNGFTILNLHALLSDELLGNSAACGRLRAIPVGISKTVYHPPEIPQLIEECFYKILQRANAIEDPFEQAFFVMVHLPYLQPFEDVNKRVSRLAANIPFIKNNLCPLSFINVPEQAYIEGTLAVYERKQVELLRDVFVFAYERSINQYGVIQHTVGEPDPFRFRYYQQIRELVANIVIKKLNKLDTSIFIRQWAENHLPEQDRIAFSTIVETELLTLTEGNIARYKLGLPIFLEWQKEWL